MPKTNKTPRSVSVRFSPDEYKFLKEQSQSTFRSVSDQVRIIVKEWREGRCGHGAG